jgi:hypothetical protein
VSAPQLPARPRAGQSASQRLLDAQLAPAISAHLPAADIDVLEAALYGPGAGPRLWGHLAAPIRACLGAGDRAAPVPEFASLLADGLDPAELATLSAEQRATLRSLALELPIHSPLLAQMMEDGDVPHHLQKVLDACHLVLFYRHQVWPKDALEAQLRRLERAIGAVRSVHDVLPSRALYELSTTLELLGQSARMAAGDSPDLGPLAAAWRARLPFYQQR